MAKNLNMTEFKQLYEGWQDSHLSVREYCASISFDENKFYYWKKKLEDSNLPTPASFVPIQMNQRGGRISISGQRPASSGKDDCCEIIYPNGVTLRIKSEMTPNVLRSLITLIQQPMFCLSDTNNFYLYPYPTDMRKSFYSLSGIVADKMGMQVQNGDAFVFINRSLTSIKILHAEYGGLVIYNMKLERGAIQLPSINPENEEQSRGIKWSELVMMVQGISVDNCKTSTRWQPKK